MSSIIFPFLLRIMVNMSSVASFCLYCYSHFLFCLNPIYCFICLIHCTLLLDTILADWWSSDVTYKPADESGLVLVGFMVSSLVFNVFAKFISCMTSVSFGLGQQSIG